MCKFSLWNFRQNKATATGYIMSYDEQDAALDEFYESLDKELYPDHKIRAIAEFTYARLNSYYLKHPEVMRPALVAYKEARGLHESKHYSAALVFFVTSIELSLKDTLLRPVVYGLVHSETLADAIVQHTIGQAGFDRYKKLLSKLFVDIADIDLATVRRDGAGKALLEEASDVQIIRNKILHQGAICSEAESSLAKEVTELVFAKIVSPMFNELGLSVKDKGLVQVG